MIAILLISFLVFIALRVPIAIALASSCLIGLAVQPTAAVPIVAQRMFVSLDSFPLMAVPLYLFAGSLMSNGGISRRIIELSDVLVGGHRSGLAQVNILTSMIFGGISGSAVADTAGMGTILIPAMKERGYSSENAAAVTAASSTIGIVIPPSIPMVIIGAMLEISVGKLFLGGLVPGLAIGFALMSVAAFLSQIGLENRPSSSFDWRRLAKALQRTSWALMMPVIVIVGITSGIVTPTEAGAVAVAYAWLTGKFIYRELELQDVLKSLTITAEATGKVFFLIAAAGLYSWLLTVNGFPDLVSNWLLSFTHSPGLLLVLIAVLLLAITTFMESIATMILLLPVLYPITEHAGIDPIHFGIIVVLSISIGLVTPPVGLCLFVSAEIAQSDVLTVAWEVLPYVVVMICMLLLFVFVPSLITTLPNLFLD